MKLWLAFDIDPSSIYITNKIINCKLVKKEFVNLLNQAYDLNENGEYEEALLCYEKILDKDPENIRALIDKGVTFQNLENFKKSIIFYDQALKINPNNLDALINKGAALHSQGKFHDAIVLYDKVLELDKKCAIALAYKGLSLGELDKIQDALKYFKKALEIDSDYELANLSKQMAKEILKSKLKGLQHTKTL